MIVTPFNVTVSFTLHAASQEEAENFAESILDSLEDCGRVAGYAATVAPDPMDDFDPVQVAATLRR